MKTIVFKGYLETLYPDGIEVEGDSAAECLSALSGYPGFRPQDGATHTVVLPEFGSRDAIYAKTANPNIVVVPAIAGAGGKLGAIALIVIGSILIATGWGAGLGVEIIGMTLTASQLTTIGVMLVLNGVTQLLMPAPEIRKSDLNEEKSNYIPANKNTVRIGTRIPLLFGRRRVWGHILSFNITAGNKPAPVVPSSVHIGGFAFAADSNYDYQSAQS